jgi:N-acetylmuramoyl-L-alanine amidase
LRDNVGAVKREAVSTRSARRRTIAGAALSLGGAAAILLALGWSQGGAAAADQAARALIGEARPGSLTLELAPPVDNVAIAGPAGRPIVVIDAGHGGRDPGATAVSGKVAEKQLTLALANELRTKLLERGRVRVAMTRTDDRYLTLEQRAGIARRLDASLYISLHMDSAPNPLARGATVYSLSDVASDAEAERLAASENAAGAAVSSDRNGSVRAILSDLALRDQMSASAELAARLVRKASGQVELRPEPHKFAAFHVLRRAEAPAVLFEAGYISNVDDEAMLTDPAKRAKMADSLARTIEADVAARRNR